MKTPSRINAGVLFGSLFFAVLSGGALGEAWTTNSANSNPDSGDPLRFTGTSGTELKISGFTTSAAGTSTAATAYSWGSGIGVDTNGREEPDYHTIGNNYGGFMDFALLDFGETLVSVSDVRLASDQRWGDGSSDKDFELWAFTGAGLAQAPTTAYGNWSSHNWTLVSLKNGGVDNAYGTDYDSFNTANSYESTSWLILAKNLDFYHDAYKLYQVKGSTAPCRDGGFGCKPSETPGVPLPGTILLLAVGALAMKKRLVA